jgi:diguanylate cyclase (GGDEF)-like protein
LIGLINIDSDNLNYHFSENDLEITDQVKCELELAIKNALAQNKLKYLANFDELTGMMNRRTLKIEFEKEIGKNNNRKISLVMIDMDNFKILNDNYGHYFGDRALKHFSEILGNSVRSSDLVARFAGDEFVLMLKDCDYVEATNRMRVIAHKMDMLKLDDIILRFSYGICEFVSNSKVEFDTILGIADTKMYEHKRRKSLLHD